MKLEGGSHMYLDMEVGEITTGEMKDDIDLRQNLIFYKVYSCYTDPSEYFVIGRETNQRTHVCLYK